MWLQVLIANRLKIVWCTKLMRASSDDETAAIEREMYNDATLVDILGQLKATRASARDRKNAIIEEVKEEARKLRTGEGKSAGGPEVLDRDVAARQVRLFFHLLPCSIGVPGSGGETMVALRSVPSAC